jgi:glycosyltransferase involved in cell wall biosynthesis
MSQDKKLKLLIATGIFPPDIGGPATYAEALIKELPKYNCEISVVTYSDQKLENRYEKSGFNLFTINRKQNTIIRYLKFFFKVWQLAKWADIIYALDLISSGLPAMLVAKLRNKRVVFRTGGDFLWEKASQKGWTKLTLKKYYQSKKNFREVLLLSFGRWILKSYDFVIFSTRLQSDIYKKYYGLPTRKIIFINNALPSLVLAKEKVEKNEYNNSIVFAGRLIKLKNLDRLLKAFSAINKKDVNLVIFGNGPEKENITELTKDLDLSDRVKIRDRISHAELIEVIRNCLFFILPSLSEISPNLVYECLSLAKPIILTRETGLPVDIIENIITIDPEDENDIKDKISYLLNPENLSNYKNKIQNIKIEKREWSEVAKDHLDVFKQFKTYAFK